ncbi:PRC-barrel domain-containing protein [Opitutus sp. ER46]|uniref:PRC-barrel domain-containing protein n=1 Tax=Opitutus sp. ER46 TaxID=2161864 RepID=UPI001304F753|nr:PRC-barrel domain-containing protein [Opitutus sp. ER46]
MKTPSVSLVGSLAAAALAVFVASAAAQSSTPPSSSPPSSSASPQAQGPTSGRSPSAVPADPAADGQVRPNDAPLTAAERVSPADPAFQPTNQSLRVASDDDRKWSADKLAGRKVRSRDGDEIGTLKDFLIEPVSGKVRFAVISTGGALGIGDTLHRVPFEQLKPASNPDDGYTLPLARADLDRLPKIDEEQFEEDKVVSADGAARSPYDAVVRATKLKDRNVQAGGNVIGNIEGVLVPQHGSTAALLMKTENSDPTDPVFAVSLERVTIPTGTKAALVADLPPGDLRKLTFASRTYTGRISTAPDAATLVESNPTAPSPLGAPSASNGSRAQDSSASAAASTASGHTAAAGSVASTTPHNSAAADLGTQTPGLTPTGQTSADQTPPGEPSLIKSVQAVRQALDSDPELARVDVTVAPEDGKVFLRGHAPNESVRDAIVKKAQAAAHGADVESRLRLQ